MNILKCDGCNIYTLEKNCMKCNKKTISIKPAKYSPLDKWGEYRRKYKKNDL
tara:strand:- start:271 stop:426 length:156 start_codon:yes stop_codon:yes gene_type:complete